MSHPNKVRGKLPRRQKGYRVGRWPFSFYRQLSAASKAGKVWLATPAVLTNYIF